MNIFKAHYAKESQCVEMYLDCSLHILKYILVMFMCYCLREAFIGWDLFSLGYSFIFRVYHLLLGLLKTVSVFLKFGKEVYLDVGKSSRFHGIFDVVP